MLEKISFVSILLLLGSAHGCYISYAIYKQNNQHENANFLLFLMVFCFSITLFYNFLDITEILRYLPHLTGFTEPIIFLYAPLLYFYVRKISSPIFVRVSWQHFLPAIFVLLVTTPFYLASAETKLDFLYSPVIKSELGLYYDSDIFEGIRIAAFLHITIYLFLVMRQLRRHKKIINDNFSYSEQINLAWLSKLTVSLIIIFGLWLLDESLFFYVDACNDQVINFSCQAVINWKRDPIFFADIGLAICMYLISILGLRQPQIFPHKSFIHETEAEIKNKIEASSDTNAQQEINHTENSINDIKYKKSSLNEDQATSLFEELLTYMDEHQPFLDVNLSLEHLSQGLGIPRHYLSQVINQCAKQNFFDFINYKRVHEAKSLLKANKSMNVLDVSLAAGFNSRSAFYKAFKKSTGMTPSQFRKS